MHLTTLMTRYLLLSVHDCGTVILLTIGHELWTVEMATENTSVCDSRTTVRRDYMHLCLRTTLTNLVTYILFALMWTCSVANPPVCHVHVLVVCHGFSQFCCCFLVSLPFAAHFNISHSSR